jgi:uncharacterized protein (TIGR02271 family)
MIEQRNDSVEEVIPLVQEHLTVGKRTVETGTVRVSTRLEEQTETITADLQRENVVVERVPVDRVIEAVPDVRWEGDTFIVPVVEEVLVVEKRLVLKEELHIRPEKSVERVEKPVVVRRTVATVERSGPRGDGN